MLKYNLLTKVAQNTYSRQLTFMNRVKKTITLPPDVIKWAQKAIEDASYPGVRSFSALVEYLLRGEMSEKVGKLS